MLMECYFCFDICMDIYFTSFHLFAHLGVNNIQATRVFNKIGYANAPSLGTNSGRKKERCDFEQDISSKVAV